MSGKLVRVLPHAVMLAVAGALYWASTRIEAETGGRIGPAVWPKAVIVFMGLLCACEIVKRLAVRTRPDAGVGLSGSEPKDSGHRMLFGGIALIAGYVFAVPWIGFFTATALFLGLFPCVGGLRRPLLAAGVSLVGTLVLAVVFLRIAYISLPLGEGPFRALSLALVRLVGVS